MAFSASESAFEGFRIIRREPATVAVWAVIVLVLSVGGAAVMAPMVRGMATSFVPGAAPNANQLAALGSLSRIFLVAVPLELIALSVFSGAVYRAVLRPEDKGFARLRLGSDELRLIGVYLLLGLFMFAVFMVIGLVAGIVSAGVIAAAGKTGMGAVGLVLVVIYLAMLLVAAWMSVKFSFAAPMTFAQRRIRLFGSWTATKGRFWPLLGCYLLAFVFMILIILVNVVVSAALVFAMSGGSLSSLTTLVNPSSAASVMNVLSPVYIARLVIGAAFGVVLWTVALAPAARAYREIVAPRPEDQAETFA